MLTLLLATTMLLPTGPKLTRLEFERLQAGVTIKEYPGPSVTRIDPQEVVVIYVDKTPPGMHPDALGFAQPERRLIVVFMENLEKHLGTDRGNPMFRIAVGRVIAHEYEHVIRGGPQHDKRGWFQSCLTRKELLDTGWSR